MHKTFYSVVYVVQHSYTKEVSIKRAEERVAATLSEFGI